MSKKLVTNHEDLLELLDAFLDQRDGSWWSAFYQDKDRKCPFFVEHFDENLVEIIQNAIIIPPARILELGCGKGRNSFYLSRNGFSVDAIDFSHEAINCAIHDSIGMPNAPNFICSSIFPHNFEGRKYDFIYDCGCFHHIAPHRREGYLALLEQRLSPRGFFGLVCFTKEGGSGLSDLEVYENRSLKGGLGISAEELLEIFGDFFEIISLRKMKEQPKASGLFGKDFLWTAAFRKKEQLPADSL